MSGDPGPGSRVLDRLAGPVGGRVRLRVVLALAAVLGLQGADTGTVGSIAVPLSSAFGVGNARVGLIVTAATVVGALATLPAGVLVDRVPRVRLLAVSVGVWTAAMVASGLAPSYVGLLVAQLALGVVLAFASPVVTSLTGDFFRAGERGRIYGFILFGELAGTGIGVVVSGGLAALSWRVPFFVLAAGSLALAVVLWRTLPEPTRGGAGRLRPGATSFDDTARPGRGEDGAGADGAGTDDSSARDSIAGAVHDAGVQARTDGGLRADPRRMTLWQAARHILSIPTNTALIAASALGYFFLQGLETFVTEYFRGRYGLGQLTASLLVVVVGAGALVGVLTGGRLADRLISRGNLRARPVVAGAGFLAAGVLLLPAFLVPAAAVGLPLLFIGAACYGATNPPLDAARLDVVEPGLWGRAEAVRSLFRRLFESLAPATFGLVSGWFGVARATATTSAAGSGGVSLSHGRPLAHTFCLMLIPLVAGGLLLLLRGARSYPGDVATAGLGS